MLLAVDMTIAVPSNKIGHDINTKLQHIKYI